MLSFRNIPTLLLRIDGLFLCTQLYGAKLHSLVFASLEKVSHKKVIYVNIKLIEGLTQK